jgi:hypothetical protein
VVAFAYIALGIPAVVLWWNIALHLRRSTPAGRQLPLGALPAAEPAPRPALASLAEEGEQAA